VRRVAAALDASAEIYASWGGRGDLDRLLDADHARLVSAWAEPHRAAGWEVWPEASFSIYGERGRIDLLSFHASSGVLEVAECKTGIWDVQDTIGRLDAKIRLARSVAAERGWYPQRVVGALVIAEGRTARRRVAEFPLLFDRYGIRGRSADAFVRAPSAAVGGNGILVFVSLPKFNQGGFGRAGARRVRRSTGPNAEG
jgi:hypothetical protein